MNPTLATLAAEPLTDCWNRIGTSGDQSCPELAVHTHCRNCPVYGSAARHFFDRPAPEGYLSGWAGQLAAPVEASDSKDLSLLIFRLGVEWLALRTRIVVEVTTPRPVHRIPHRTDDVLSGMINLRGRLQLQVSIRGLLGVGGGGSQAEGTARLVVIAREGHTWVFEADDVLGVHRFARSKLGAVPSTLADPTGSFSQAVINWREKSIGYLDDERVFAALRDHTP